MTEKTINCAECNVEFTFEENPKYPRKYCLNCSAKKKQEWGGKGDQKYSKEGYGAPVEKVGTQMARNGTKEYHLSPEQVRSNALSCAIEALKQGINDMDMLKKLPEIAEKFEEWINGSG